MCGKYHDKSIHTHPTWKKTWQPQWVRVKNYNLRNAVKRLKWRLLIDQSHAFDFKIIKDGRQQGRDFMIMLFIVCDSFKMCVFAFIGYKRREITNRDLKWNRILSKFRAKIYRVYLKLEFLLFYWRIRL